MKTLVICYWDIGVGGIGSRIRSLLLQLSKRENLKVICLFKKARPEYKKLALLKNITINSFSEGEVKGRKIEFFFWLIKNILKEKPTHMLGFLNRFALVFAIAKVLLLLRGKKVKAVIDQPIGTWKYLWQYESVLWWYPLTVLSFTLVDQLTVPTYANSQDIVKHFFINRDKIKIIPSSIDTHTMKKDQQKKFNAIFVGRFSKEKGLETIVETVDFCSKINPSFILAVLGEGELKEWFLTQISDRNLNKNIKYFGFKLNSRKYIKESNVLLLPSYNEGLPMVILEAYAESVPVVATPYEGVTEAVLHGQTGLIVSRKSFAKRVNSLLADKASVKKMGQQALVFAKKNFSKKNLVMFADLISGK